MGRVLRGWVAGALAVTAIATVGLAPAERVGAAPTITIEPAGDLVDGQRVMVGGSGLPVDDGFVLLAQCPSTVTSVFEGPCRYAGGEEDGNGDVEIRLAVRAVVADDGGGSATWTGAADVGCTVDGTGRADAICGLGGDDTCTGELRVACRPRSGT